MVQYRAIVTMADQ